MQIETYDVVVVGGGAGGVSAAAGAAAAGARVALVEKYGFLGGAATNSSVLAYCGFFTQAGEQVVRGIGQQFIDILKDENIYRAEKQAHSGNTIVLLDRETTKRTLDKIVGDANIDLYLHTHFIDADTDTSQDGSSVKSIRVQHRGGFLQMRAESFVDASGDAMLGFAAESDLHISPPEQRQGSTLVMHVGGVPNDVRPPTGRDMDRAIELRARQTGITLPRSNGVCVRSPITDELMLLLADQHMDALDVEQLTKAEVNARTIAAEILTTFRQNLPGWEHSYLSHTGPQIGIRETRRIAGKEMVRAHHIYDGYKNEDDGIAKCGWPIEDHSQPGRTTYAPIGDVGWYHIGHATLQSHTHTNMWAAGRTISSDPRAYASTRVMGTGFATGHAAGVSAALQASSGVRSLDTHSVRMELLRQGADI